MLFSICVYMRKTKKHKKKSLFLRLKNNKTKSPMDGIQRHSQFLFAAVCEVCRIFYFVVNDVQLYIVHFSCCLVIVNWVCCCCGTLCFVKLIELNMKSRVDLEVRKNHRRSVKPLWYFLIQQSTLSSILLCCTSGSASGKCHSYLQPVSPINQISKYSSWSTNSSRFFSKTQKKAQLFKDYVT